ncbi:collagen alpha-5(IV) chain-like [Cloeon dipterum]|uniref:collagen alpha-5(IV) chain-like n=1 Tax=Cloeon dipterum TaxID=197152 RepID=UPI003220806C
MVLCYYVVVRDPKRKRRGSLGSTGTAEIIMWLETMPPSLALLLTFVFVTAPARALEWPDRPRVDLPSQPTASTQKNHHVTQIHSLSDFKYKITAYRDAKEKTCYLQSIASSNNKHYLELYKNVLYEKRETRKIPKTFYTVPGSLSKSQVLHLAGARVASYCRGFTTMILLPGPPQSMTNDFPDSAESPPPEPSLPRYLKEQMQKRRQKRNAKGKRRYQGQTQVQTIALGGDQLNTAESLAQKNTSQIKLSTTRGMSQAQSQSIYEEDCDGCGDRQSNRNGYSWGQIYDQSGQDAGVGFRPNEMHTPGRGIPNRRPSGQGYDHDKPSGTGLKPGELYRPDGQKFGSDGRPAQPWDMSRPIDGGIRPGLIHGPDGQNYGTDGRPVIQQTPIGGGVRPAIGSNNRQVGQAGVTQQNHESGLRTGGNNEPGRQIYGPGGRHFGQGETTGPTDDSKFRPGESYGQGSYGTDGIPVSPTIQEPFGPGGLYRPGQIDVSDRRPNGQRGEATDNLGSGLKPGDINGQGGQIYGTGGKTYQPDRGPIGQGSGTYSPGLSSGPGGQIHGTDGRPSSPDIKQGQPQITDVGEIRPGETYRPGGNLVGLGEQREPTGTELGPSRPYDQHKLDSNYKPICYWHCAPGATPPPSKPIFPGSTNIQPGRQVYIPAGRPIQPVVNGVRPGETYRPGGHIYGPGGQSYGPDGRPISTGTGGLQPGGQIFGPGGQSYGPGGQNYGPDGRPISTGTGGLRPGETFGPGGQSYGPDGRPISTGTGGLQPGGQSYGHDGQSYGPDGRPISTGTGGLQPGGHIYGPGGQSYGPDGRPISTGTGGLRPGEKFGPGGQSYGPDRRPTSTGTGGLQPGGQIYSYDGQSYGPDGRPISTGTGGLQPGGHIYGPGGQSYGPDGRPISTGTGGLQPGGHIYGPGGQSYGPNGRPISTGTGGLRPGEKFGPGGQSYGPDGRPTSTGTGGLLQPGGQIYSPGGQSYGHDGRPIPTVLRPGETYGPGGQIYGPGGQSYGPDGRPIKTGLRPGETYGPGGQNYGPDGRPITTGTGGLRTGETHSPGGQSYGPDGRPITTGLRPGETYGPGGQIYGPDGRPISSGIGGLRPGETYGTGGQSYGPDGRLIQTGLRPGETYGPGGQIYGPGGRPITTGTGGLRPGETHSPGGQSYGPDGRPITTGLRPGETYGPSGQIYGPDGRPISSGTGGLRPGETHGPGGQSYGPDGRPTPTEPGGLQPGGTYSPGGQSYGPDGRPIPTGLRPGETYGPGGQSYRPDGRPIQTGLRPGETHGPGGPSYGPGGRPTPTGTGGLQPGGTYSPGGQSYGPDGRPIPTGLRPGETYGPGGQIYGPDGRPIPSETGGLRPGETYGPGGQSYGPDGRPIQTGLRPGETHGPGGKSYGPDGRPTSIGIGGLQPGGTYSPGGQSYGPDGRPITTGTGGLRPGETYGPGGQLYGPDGRPVSSLVGGQISSLSTHGFGVGGKPIYGPDGRPITPGSGGTFGPGGQSYGPVSFTSNNGNGAQQYSPEDLGENDGHSQVKTSISQQNNETIASSSSQGSYGGGKTQTSVSGSYKGSGSFSAQAQTIDTKRGAQSQVVGGDDGASSSAQAFGGKGQSQSQVSLSPETGLTSANSQTTGSGYSTQSEIHASETGGNSVAQATGVGKTSSQAQVKFKPYQNGRESDSQRIPFLGSGSASAQTGPRTGISQSEIFGSFKYGISYTGAAQASSGSKIDREKDGLAPFKELVFNSTDVKSNTTYVAKPAEQSPVQTEETVSTTQKYDEDYGSSVEDDDDDEDIASTGVPQTAQTLDRGDQPSTHLNTNEDLVTAQSQHGNPQLYPYVTQVDLPPDALESGYLRQRQEDKNSHIRPQSAFSMNNFKQEQYQSSFNQQPYQRQVVTVGKPTNTIARAPNSQRKGNYGNPAQSQSVILGDISNMGVRVMQDADGIGLSSGDVYKSDQSVPGKSGYQIPPGFRGRVVGVNGDYAQASNNQGGQAQTQTVILTPGPGKYEYKGPENRKSADVDYDEYGPEDDSDEEQDTHPPNSNHQNYGRAFQAPPASFVSVTQKVSSQAPYSPPKEFEHTYFTKASKCGYTTYSCQLIDGSNGRAKVCKPKVTKNGNCE